MPEVIFVVGVVKFIHLMRSSMRIVPDELFGPIEVFGFEDRLLNGVGRMGED